MHGKLSLFDFPIKIAVSVIYWIICDFDFGKKKMS